MTLVTGLTPRGRNRHGQIHSIYLSLQQDPGLNQSTHTHSMHSWYVLLQAFNRKVHQNGIISATMWSKISLYLADLFHFDISSDVCLSWNSRSTLPWISRQPMMIEQWFNFFKTLPHANKCICSIRIYLEWKKCCWWSILSVYDKRDVSNFLSNSIYNWLWYKYEMLYHRYCILRRMHGVVYILYIPQKGIEG